ncbi:MAG: hypothetical protein COU07_03540 [Candidatus Harrisonbacteria bacterium CG10_big_fil_rev_8_21_14_0_10_40_38]|uniref:Uncharacterized protein n=1 Tax=Candidatus Harrisonbacteria bacterium CG10_big_fil_rev_8_21_14_0_10_40_38 TaxID=1974583 RepID=A0A2H0URB7_9BACT|nr:MAG: hypothetical protein COU07_03540 [Candidatus Harrisonbacteria bacterium CG10_big_fil_rev_8_21_14_0_10_40_38]
MSSEGEKPDLTTGPNTLNESLKAVFAGFKKHREALGDEGSKIFLKSSGIADELRPLISEDTNDESPKPTSSEETEEKKEKKEEGQPMADTEDSKNDERKSPPVTESPTVITPSPICVHIPNAGLAMSEEVAKNFVGKLPTTSDIISAMEARERSPSSSGSLNLFKWFAGLLLLIVILIAIANFGSLGELSKIANPLIEKAEGVISKEKEAPEPTTPPESANPSADGATGSSGASDFGSGSDMPTSEREVILSRLDSKEWESGAEECVLKQEVTSFVFETSEFTDRYFTIPQGCGNVKLCIEGISGFFDWWFAPINPSIRGYIVPNLLGEITESKEYKAIGEPLSFRLRTSQESGSGRIIIKNWSEVKDRINS